MIILPLHCLEQWNPFEHIVWGGLENPITQEEVTDAISEERLRKELDNSTRGHHVERIAWFVVNGWKDSIDIDVGIPSLGCYVNWIITDGNHRLAAAFYRKDDNIETVICGDEEHASELFGVETLRNALNTVYRDYKGHDGKIYRCTAYDPRQGFWMEETKTGERRNVSERAIGRAFHEINAKPPVPKKNPIKVTSDNLKGYLQTTLALKCNLMNLPSGYNYHGSDDYVLDRGHIFKPQSLTETELKQLFFAIDRWGQRFKLGECFYNSQMLLLCDTSESLSYYEGFACGPGGGPVIHAWVSIGSHKVIDVTWRTEKPNHKGRLKNRIFGEIPEGWCYYGVEIPRSNIIESVMEDGLAHSHLEDWKNGFPLFQLDRFREVKDLVQGVSDKIEKLEGLDA